MKNHNISGCNFSPEAFNAGNSLKSFETNRKSFSSGCRREKPLLSIRVQIGSTSEDRPSEFDIPENWEDSNNQQSKNPGFYKFHQLLTSRILLRKECIHRVAKCQFFYTEQNP